MRLVRLGLSFVGVVLVGGACSTTVPKSYLPVDSPLHAWAAPDQEAASEAPAPPPPEKKPAPKKK
jgi:hypothetical protein